jgi:hypothetical protein
MTSVAQSGFSFVPSTSLPSFFVSTHWRHYQKKVKGRCKMKKRRHHSNFLPTLCLLLSHLAHFDEGPNNHSRKRSKTPHRSTKVEDRLPTLEAMFLFISLLFASSFFESRDEILFRGVDLSHPKICQFQDVNKENN